MRIAAKVKIRVKRWGLYGALASVMLYACVGETAAATTCEISPTGGKPTIQLDTVPTISATDDLPVGTVLFRGRLNAVNGTSLISIVECYIPSGTGTETVSLELRNRVANGVLVGSDDYTYQTSVPGIGVRYYLLGHYVTSTLEAIADQSSLDGVQATATLTGTERKKFFTTGNLHRRNLTFMLVKTGPVAPAALNALTLPRVEFSVHSIGGTVNKLPARYMIINFAGNVNITAPTCTTPARVDVDLGSYTASQISAATPTPWKDASIRLTNCQKFTGYQNKGDSKFDQAQISGSYTVGPTTFAAYTNNVLGVTLNGNQGNLDSAKGIVATKGGVGQAEGIAVQVSKGGSANLPVSLGSEYTQTLANNGAASIVIPLSARLIATGKPVKAGNVSAQVTYTINYK